MHLHSPTKPKITVTHIESTNLHTSSDPVWAKQPPTWTWYTGLQKTDYCFYTRPLPPVPLIMQECGFKSNLLTITGKLT